VDLCFAFLAAPVFSSGVANPPHAAPADRSDHPRVCLNCSAVLTGPFCAQCGQHDIDYHRSFHHLFHDILENLFHFEGKFFVTVAWLLSRPGRITLEFLNGRRASQLNPLRFYLLASVMLFLGIALLNHGHLIDLPHSTVNRLQQEVSQQARQLSQAGRALTPEQKQALARRLQEAARQHPDHFDPAAIAADFQREQVAAATAPLKTEVQNGTKAKTTLTVNRDSSIGRQIADRLASGELTVGDMWEAIEHRVPTMVFLGVPLFALFLKLGYLRTGRYYVEHLIFSLHLHTWAFLVFMVGNGYLKLAALGPGWLGTASGWLLALWMAWYVFRSFRVVYGQGRLITAVKIAALGFVHAIAVLGVCFLLIAGTLAWLALE